MRKTFNKKRKIIKNKNKNRKTKKQMKGGIGDLGEHVFIGYKIISRDSQSGHAEHTPIIIPKNFPMAKTDKNYSYYNEFDYSNGLSNAMKRYFGSGNITDIEKNIAGRYNIYLPYLNELTNIDKINIYDLINKGMKFMDNDGISLNILINNVFDFNKKMCDMYNECNYDFLKDNSKKYDVYKRYMLYGNTNLYPLMENIYYKKLMKDEQSNQQSFNFYKQKYDRTLIEIDELFKQFPLLKEVIQDLEYRYQGIIEPILLTDEASIYNYANGPEPSISERIDRTSRVLEEGLKKI